MKTLITITYSLTMLFLVITGLTFIWALIDVFFGDCDNTAGYSFITSLIIFVGLFVTSMGLTTKERNRYEDSDKQ